MSFFATKDLDVGYNGRVLIRDIGIQLEKGKILTLIGPNGAGKSTILKSITRHLKPIRGDSYLDGQATSKWSLREFARRAAVVLTERIHPELMTCAEVVVMGRYPYTGLLGRLTPEDKRIVEESLARVHAQELAGQQFNTLSDGQRQRVLLARAICQKPEVIVLDEPTAYLDIRHKLELLDILRTMARDEGITVIMSLHEIDLAMKASDLVLCVKGDTVAAFGTPEEVLAQCPVEQLYDMDKGSYDPLFGSVEMKKPEGAPQVFVLAGDGKGIPLFRSLQKQGIPFATGVLFENDVDLRVARELSGHVVSAPAFTEITGEQVQAAMALLERCGCYLDAGTELRGSNAPNGRLLELARQRGIPEWRGSI